jgi:hypothetical protein
LATLAALLAALASGLLLLLAGFLLATAALLTALTRLLFLLTWLLTTATLLSALAWILISHDLVSPAGKFPQRTTFIPQVRSSGKVMHLTAGHRAGGLNKANKAQIAKDCSEQFHTTRNSIGNFWDCRHPALTLSVGSAGERRLIDATLAAHAHQLHQLVGETPILPSIEAFAT